MAELNIETIIKSGVEKALNKPIMGGKSITEWAAIGMNAPRWISVKDRLPENRSMCLTYSPKGKMRVAEAFLPNPDDYPNDCWWSVHGQGGAHYVAVTHWMPLPEPPKEATKND